MEGKVGRFHTPHKNGINTDKGAVSSLKKYLTDCGITPYSTKPEGKDNDDDNLIYGLVINLERDTITFRGEAPAETKQDFQETIDEYLADCITDGIEADVPKVLATT